MNTEITTSVLESLGYQVLSLDRGVYVLQNRVGGEVETFVALVLVDFPVRTGTVQSKLFLQSVPDQVDVVDIVELWKDLDARRFEESGLLPTEFELGPVSPEALVQMSFERPGGGVRYGVKLSELDVVCFN